MKDIAQRTKEQRIIDRKKFKLLRYMIHDEELVDYITSIYVMCAMTDIFVNFFRWGFEDHQTIGQHKIKSYKSYPENGFSWALLAEHNNNSFKCSLIFDYINGKLNRIYITHYEKNLHYKIIDPKLFKKTLQIFMRWI